MAVEPLSNEERWSSEELEKLTKRIEMKKVSNRGGQAGDRRRYVMVIGAGITGLSAAHELAERGFNVVVVEKESELSGDADVGGVAKSQWYDFGAEPPDTEGGSASGRGTDAAFRPLGRLKKYVRSAPHAQAEAARVGAERTAAEEALSKEPGPKGTAAPTAPLAPGEHGFRFFPAFYRNLFDTMRRTPLVGDGPGDAEADPYRTVFDNLVPMGEMYVGLGDAEPPLRIPRSKPASLDELFRMMDEMYRRLDFGPSDSARFQYELLKWMTASGKRRAEWSEPSEKDGIRKDGSWWDHIQASKRYSEGFQQQMRATSMALVGMRESEIDARTYGNIAVQLLLDQLGHGDRVDYSLNGPTSEAWFDHWKAYLRELGVAFATGTVTRLTAADGALAPEWSGGAPAIAAARTAEGQADPDEHLNALQSLWLSKAPDYYVCALPLAELFHLANESWSSDPAGPFKTILAWKRKAHADEATRRASSEASADPQPKTPPSGAEVYDPRTMTGKMPFRTMAGVQFFSADHLHIERGHIYFPNSKWWLSALVQSNHWRVRSGRYRGILSVDVSGFLQPDIYGRLACDLTKKEFSEEVLRQIIEGRGAGQRFRHLPPVSYTHVDNYLRYDTAGILARNDAPYLINLPGQWEVRPGRTVERESHKRTLDDITYERGFNDWVVAGPHCKTWTRLATMEAANESARHAVNAILDDVAETLSTAGVRDPRRWAPVPVENLEDYEVDDFAVFRQVDAHLCEDGVPHLFEVLKLDELLERVSGSTTEGKVAKAFDEVLRDRYGVRSSSAEQIGDILGRARKALENLIK